MLSKEEVKATVKRDGFMSPNLQLLRKLAVGHTSTFTIKGFDVQHDNEVGPIALIVADKGLVFPCTEYEFEQAEVGGGIRVSVIMVEDYKDFEILEILPLRMPHTVNEALTTL